MLVVRMVGTPEFHNCKVTNGYHSQEEEEKSRRRTP